MVIDGILIRNTEGDHFKRYSISLEGSHFAGMESRRITAIKMVNKANPKEFYMISHEHFAGLAQKRVHKGAFYTVNMKFTQIKSETPVLDKVLASPYMNQREISEHYGIHPSRVSIFVDLGWLKPIGKQRQTFLYKREDVLNLSNKPEFALWLKEHKGEAA